MIAFVSLGIRSYKATLTMFLMPQPRQSNAIARAGIHWKQSVEASEFQVLGNELDVFSSVDELLWEDQIYKSKSFSEESIGGEVIGE